MAKKRIVMAIGHKDMGTNLPEQKAAAARTEGSRKAHCKSDRRLHPGRLAGCHRSQQRTTGRNDPHSNE